MDFSSSVANFKPVSKISLAYAFNSSSDAFKLGILGKIVTSVLGSVFGTSSIV